MHSFWTLVRAEFVVEILSRILFSGRFPRAVAVLIAFFIGSFLIGWWFVLRVLDLAKWIIYREKVRVWVCFRKIRKISQRFQDLVEVLSPTDQYYAIRISSENYRHDVLSVEIRIDRRTERASFFLRFETQQQELPHEFFKNYCGAYERYDLHRIFVPYLFSQAAEEKRLRENPPPPVYTPPPVVYTPPPPPPKRILTEKMRRDLEAIRKAKE